MQHLQKTQHKLNQALQTYGLQIKKEDLVILKQNVQQACIAFDLVETDYAALYQLIEQMAASPYVDATHFLPMMKNAIFSYYRLRAAFHWDIDDKTIIQTLIACHMQYGEFNKTLYQRCKKRLEAL